MLAPSLAPELVCVLDICETLNGLRLLELNPFGGADLYAYARPAIVRGSCEPSWAPRRAHRRSKYASIQADISFRRSIKNSG